MKIAVIGRGGREHALSWKLAQSVGVENVFCLPGNGGTANNRAIDEMDFQGIRAFCEAEGIHLVVVGPEVPLERGIVDELSGSSFHVFGPSRSAVRLESSKAWAKDFMLRHGIATAAGSFFDSPQAAVESVRSHSGGVVVKYSGLAAGKGVFVCSGPIEALEALEQIKKRHGPDAPVIIEERLSGPEVSVMGITDGKTIQLFPTSRDHKRLLNKDEGPNTGGMGAYTPVSEIDADALAEIKHDIIDPTLSGLAEEGIAYRGFLYFGLMMTAEGPKLLEYNARLGDPEAEVLLPALDGDLLPALLACFDGSLDAHPLTFKAEVVLDVVLAASGYPDAPRIGDVITGLDGIDARVFHAGTDRQNGKLVTSGGRVLNVVASGPDLESARQKAVAACKQIEFNGMQYRTDIGEGRGLV